MEGLGKTSDLNTAIRSETYACTALTDSQAYSKQVLYTYPVNQMQIKGVIGVLKSPSVTYQEIQKVDI